jgi:hypothetical protein
MIQVRNIRQMKLLLRIFQLWMVLTLRTDKFNQSQNTKKAQ